MLHSLNRKTAKKKSEKGKTIADNSEKMRNFVATLRKTGNINYQYIPSNGN